MNDAEELYMAQNRHIIRVLLVTLFVIGGARFDLYASPEHDNEDVPIAFSKVPSDTLTGNMYMKFNLDIHKRNVLLHAIPHLYSIAQGSRHHVGEAYGQYTLDRESGKYTFEEQLRIATIRRQRTVFRNALTYLHPTIYNEEVFHGLILSPFNKRNKRLYRYETREVGDLLYVKFRPRVLNSVLTSGTAIINQLNGKIIDVVFNGEYDQMKYNLNVIIDSVSDTPKKCFLHTDFNFFGNKISSNLYASYNTPTTLPGIISDSNDPKLMAMVRPDSLTIHEKLAYGHVYKDPEPEDTMKADTKRKHNIFHDVFSTFNDVFIRSIRFNNEKASLRLSPILDPGALSYSKRKGLAYRMKLRSYWTLDNDREWSINARLGYNFKQKQLFYTAPLRYTFNEKRNGYVEMLFANGNRISNSIIYERIKKEAERDSMVIDNLDLEYYDKREISFHLNLPIGRHFHADFATFYYKRDGVNKAKLQELGQKTVYHSFAPSLILKYQPSSYVAYVLSYERSIPGLLGCDSKYERIEGDAMFAIKYNALTSLNFRIGGGFYTDMSSNYFVDYENFAENYLPEAWDKWSCNFFLLDSYYYNASRYYVRGNISYESPMLPLAYIPYLGYYIEKERIYLSAVQLHKTRPYFELGYAFTTRYATLGVFAGTFGNNFHEFGAKITFELFHRY